MSGPSSTRALYALLVGIDAYERPVPALNGCVNDVEQVASWLQRRAEAAGDRLELKVIRNQEARRRAVIDAFRQHLGAASAEDTALFYYSGHGAQERAVLPEHLEVEPDGLNETLVLVDSRHDGVYDLADKELAQLVGDVAATAGHVLVVLDCCHSGSGVRAADEDGVGVRRAPTDQRERPRESYLTGGRSIEAAGPDANADWLNIADGGYVLLAACQPDQTAKEVRVDGQTRGAFSVALERALAGLGGQPTYLDVHRSAAAAVRNLAVAQWPVLESPQPQDVSTVFLGGVAMPAAPILTVSFVSRRGWVLDAGRLHGIGPRTVETPTEVSLHPLGADADPAALTTATVTEVGGISSIVEVAEPDALDEATTYRAVLTTAGQPQASVAVIGSGSVAGSIRRGLEASPIVELLAGEDADIVVTCDADELRLTRPSATRPLAAATAATDPQAADRVLRSVEHIGRWIGIAQRQNPSSQLGPNAVRLTVYDAGGAELGTGSGPIEVFYTRAADGTEVNPSIKIQYANSSERRLHCAVLVLTELYGVTCLTTGGSVLLRQRDQAWVLDPDGEPLLQTFVPAGQERTTDLLKLMVSTEPFDAQRLQQDDLQPPTRTRGAEVDSAEKGIGGRPVTPAGGPDWATREVLVTTVRPGEWQSVPSRRSDPLELGDGVEVVGHSKLSAEARLAARPTASREAIIPLLPPALLDPGVETEPFTFGATRTIGEELSVLELDKVEESGALTAEEPLLIRVDRPLAPGELVLPVAFDGEDYLPLGHAASVNGGTEIRLSRLPAQTALTTRSLGGSLKILFRKLVLSKLGLDYPYPLLSMVSYDGGQPRYEHDPAVVRRATRAAGRVLLVVHGIIGDTRGMTEFLNVSPDPIRNHYDAVLALDYENINSPISETAAALAARVSDIDLDSGQRMDVVAHSMGGLVSRWWIEREGGAAAVRRLVTCGTPHQGSPWPRVQDIATAALALGLNGFGGLVGNGLAFLLRGVEAIDDALDDMQPGSEMLTALAGSSAPQGVHYVAIAGDEPFGTLDDASRGKRILRKVRLPGVALKMLFEGTPNDLAVSVASASAVGRAWSTRPEVLDADCSHINYFAANPGVTAVRRGLGL